MKKKRVATIYPHNVERSFARSMAKYIDEMEKVALTVVNTEIGPIVSSVVHDVGIRNDLSFENMKKVLNKLNVFFRGIFSEKTAFKESSKFVNAVNTVNKSNIQRQVAVRGIKLSEHEPWVKSFMKAKTQENASYMSTIPDEFYNKVAQSVYRTVSNGGSLQEITEDIVKYGQISRDRAAFIARDQTGSILGQMTAERHQRSGFPAFRWSDSGDNRVRPSHKEKNDKVFLYADNPALPGEDFGCRCVAEPIDDEELAEYMALQNTDDVEYNYIKNNEYNELVTSNVMKEEDVQLIHSPLGYVGTPNSFNINEILRYGSMDDLSLYNQKVVHALDNSIDANKTDRPLLVDRWVGVDWLQSFFADKRVEKRTNKESITDWLNKYKGTTFVDPGFSSGSLIPENNLFSNRPFRLVIQTPAGTHMYAPNNRTESEIIFGRQSVFEIVKADLRHGERNSYVEIVLKYREGDRDAD